jgi:hypothetical protein
MSNTNGGLPYSPPEAREKTRASIYRVVLGPFVKKTRRLKKGVVVSPWLAATEFFRVEENSQELFFVGPSDFGKSQIQAVWGIRAVWGQSKFATEDTARARPAIADFGLRISD